MIGNINRGKPMSVLMEVDKVSGLVMKDGYNSLNYSEKLQCLVSVRTAIEKEIAFTEKDFNSLSIKG